MNAPAGITKVTFCIPESLHHLLKMEAASRKTTMSELVELALRSRLAILDAKATEASA